MDGPKQTKTASKNGKNQDDVRSRTAKIAKHMPKQHTASQNGQTQAKMDRM